MLAIVIPYYKHAFFEATLQSLAQQTDKRFHVYIGDDASQIQPDALLKQFHGQFSFSYHRFPDNLGGKSLVKQWERCMALTNNEEWLMILGDDDTFAPNVVASFYENLETIESEKITVVRFATRVINEKGDVISPVYHHPQLESAADFLMRKFKGGTRSSLSEYFFKKEKVDAIQFKDFPLAWSSDTLAVIEFSGSSKIFTINDALVYFRLSGKNISSQADSVDKNNAWFKFYDYLLTNYGKQFAKELVAMLFDRLEKVQLNNKKTPLRWAKLFWHYIAFSQYSRFFSIFKKVKKSIL